MIVWELLVRHRGALMAQSISRSQAQKLLAEQHGTRPTHRARRMWRVSEDTFVGAIYLPAAGKESA